MKIKSIVFTGPESSGKTTIASKLASYFQCPLVEEYAREYLTINGPLYDHQDFIYISRSQYDKILNALKQFPLVIFDTDITTLLIWEMIKFKQISPWLKEAWQNENFDLIFLCKPDFPWKSDPLRENEFDQYNIFSQYLAKLLEQGQPFYIISGPTEDRMTKILKIINMPNSSI